MFWCLVPRYRNIEEVRSVLALKAEGRTDIEVSALTGVPVNTIRAWRNHGLPEYAMRGLAGRASYASR
jgi:hypothetical protein